MNISDEFKQLFEGGDNLDHKSAMISLRILSEVEKVMENRVMTKKQLAEKCGTSASYITQLFRGAKYVNVGIMAKFELALGITFTINSQLNK